VLRNYFSCYNKGGVLNQIKHYGLIILFLVTNGLFGARPFTIDDAGTVAQGGFELESGLDYWDEQGVIGVSFKHGLTPKMDLGIGFGYTLMAEPEPENRFSGVEMCLKYNLMPDFISASMTTAFQPDAYVLNGIITRCFGDLEFNGNLGFNIANNTITYGGAIIYDFIEKLHIGIEASGDKDGLGTWLIGANYSVLEVVNIDCGFMSDFDMESKTVTFGFHAEF
jgi:hypothetical protein